MVADRRGRDEVHCGEIGGEVAVHHRLLSSDAPLEVGALEETARFFVGLVRGGFGNGLARAAAAAESCPAALTAGVLGQQ